MHAAQGPAWALALEHSALGEAMRGSVLLYPIIETAHILGFATLIGSILVLDMRLLGFAQSVRPAALARLAIPIAAIGLCVAAAAGIMLFVTEAAAYVRNPAFLLKQLLIVLGLINIVLFHRWLRPGMDSWAKDTPPPAARASAVVSALIWLTVPVCGRLIAYV